MSQILVDVALVIGTVVGATVIGGAFGIVLAVVYVEVAVALGWGEAA